MHENFESYKTDLDRVRLTEESKQALTEHLLRHSAAASIQPQKRPLRARHVLAAAAVIALLSALSVAAVAQVNAEPTLGGAFTGDQAGYDQASGTVGRMAEVDGWTATITDCVGDDFQAFLGVEVEAPEGTVLDAEYYEIYVDNEYDRQGVPGTTKGFCYSLPDDDPTDNKIRLIYDWYTTEGESNHVRMRFTLMDLVENHGYNWDARNWNRETVKEGAWDFGWIDIDYADNALRLAPMAELPFPYEKLVLEEVVISPVGLYLRTNISTPYPIAYGDWFREEMSPTIRLLDVDGSEIFVYAHFSGLGGAYFSFSNHTNAMNSANGEGLAELRVVDLERLASVSVAGVEIPLQ